ncbi:GDSL-type esterase/lipase family protein [Microbacterium sp. NPDC056052]|uniref:GDSL-type esterase/lipase family protein n=1 Tax=Microbacterium sp. NPDC056052 TaxID=3345695 RepID=UPI0035D884F5
MISQMVQVGRLQVATPASMAMAIRNPTEAQAEVDARIVPVATTVISNSPELIDAAAERALTTANVSLTTTPMVPSLFELETFPLGGVLVRDPRGRVLSYTPPGGPEQYAAPIVESGIQRSAVAFDGVGWAPFVLADGRLPGTVLDTWGRPSSATVVTWRMMLDCLLSWVAVGDSITQGVGGGGTTWPAELSALLGIEIANRGVSGYTASEAELTAGGLTVSVFGTIATSGASSVTVTVTEGYNPRDAAARSFPGTLQGVTAAGARTTVQGTLSIDTGGAWSFTPAATLPAAVAMAAPFMFQSSSVTVSSHPFLWFAGRNEPSDSDVVAALQSRVNRARSHGVPYLILSTLNAQSEPSGSSGYATILAQNDAKKTVDPARFVDIRKLFVQYGPEVLGTTRTTADATALTEDRPAPSLMSDDLHPNANGYRAIARLLAPYLIRILAEIGVVL